ncbi:TetR/AcrR family transcriptional regulator C-terminal domain-containing protein [Microbispora hainanensis]|uniref:TetR/AcrR family transcriptional regulator n=1 Tax=Microbispora hainanensis TaxID=568844 RepID=UPI002E2D76F7|nr:TetR/AcrR family transcriptional regulator C-terminal domain-containing protein [Microbispora hainanensis]
MTTRARQSVRRRQVLSREQIIASAIELLDDGGEGALTVRALTERLATGTGAIYYHVGTRDELLDAATEIVIAAALAARTDPASPAPEDEIRATALSLFGAIAEHAWLATQLTTQFARRPSGPVTVGIFERIGRQVRALGVPQAAWFSATSTLVHYILGAVSQHVRFERDAHGAPGDVGREKFLGDVAAAWQDLDADAYPFVRAIAGQMREHDDREQFLSGIALILDGIARLR